MSEPSLLERRFTELDAPFPWAVGKTVAEVAQIGQSMMETVRDYTVMGPNPTSRDLGVAGYEGTVHQTQPQPQPAQPAPTAPGYPEPTPPDPSGYYNDAEGYARDFQRYLERRDKLLQERVLAQVQQLAAPLLRNTAAQSRSMVASDPEYTEIFSQYGHEIDAELLKNKVAETNRTVDVYKMVADMIRGRHYKELARKEAERLMAGGGTATVRVDASNYGSMPPSGDALDRLWESDHDYVKALKGNRVTKRQLRESIAKQGHSIDQWVKLIDGGEVFVAPDGKTVTTRR